MKYFDLRFNINTIKYILIALFPIMALYEFLPLLNIGYFLLLVLIIINTIIKNFNININYKMLAVMFVLIVINLLVGLNKYIETENTINNSVGMAVFALLASFILTSDFLDKEELYNKSKIVALLATFFLFYQFVEYKFFGNVILGKLPLLNPIEEAFGSITYGRPTSFFYEPAHYALYIGPIYALSLMKREFVTSLVLLIGLILSTSATGIIFALTIPVIVLLNSGEKFSFKHVALIITGLLALIIVSNTFYDQFFQKISFDALLTNIRVFGTIDYFRHFGTEDWLFGIGINRLREFLLQYGYSHTMNYSNAYIFSFLSFGLIGGIIWSVYNISLYKNLKPGYKIIFYVFIIICFTDQVLFNRNLLYLLMWVYAVSMTHTRFAGHS